MRRRVYRSLDRPTTFMGIKGRFLIVMGLGGAVSLIVALIAGQLTSMLMGFGVAVVLMTLFYFLTTSLQAKIPEKNIWKTVIKKGYPSFYRTRPKHIRNIWRGFNLAPRK